MTLERHYTTRELADMLRVNPETIRRAARRVELQSLRVGLKRRYPESAVVEWLGSLASPSPVRPAA